MQPMITVRDVEASSRFYQAALGVTSGHGGSEYEALMSDDRVVLQLHHRPDTEGSDVESGNGVVLTLRVDDFDDAVARVCAAGARVLVQEHLNTVAGHREIWFEDPDGYTVTLVGS